MATSAEISVEVFDVTAKNDVITSGNAMQPWCNFKNVTDETTTTTVYGTLEPHQCKLDGSMAHFPENPAIANMGIYSNAQSNDAGQFATPIKVIINFTEYHSSSGLTLQTNAKDVEIEWFTKFQTIKAVYNFDKFENVIEKTVENFNKIEITCFTTQTPNRYLRFSKILFGIDYIFKGENILTGKIIEEVDVTSATISQNVCDFSFYDKAARFNMLDNNGAFPALQKTQRIKVKENQDGKIIQMGTFYLTDWENKGANILSCKSADIMCILEQFEFLGGFFETTASKFFKNLLNGFEYTINSSLNGKKIVGYMPISNKKEALQQAAFAIGAVVNCSRGSAIKIEPFAVLPTKLITSSKKFVGGKITTKPKTTKLEVKLKKYIAETSMTEILNENITGNIKLMFDSPTTNLTIAGGEILKSNANYVILNGNGNVILNGKINNEQNIIKSFNFPNLPPNTLEKTIKIEDSAFLTTENVDNVANFIIAYFENIFTHTFKKLMENEMVGEIIITEIQGKKLKGFIEKQEIDLTGGFLSNITMVGSYIDTNKQMAMCGEIHTNEGWLI